MQLSHEDPVEPAFVRREHSVLSVFCPRGDLINMSLGQCSKTSSEKTDIFSWKLRWLMLPQRRRNSFPIVVLERLYIVKWRAKPIIDWIPDSLQNLSYLILHAWQQLTEIKSAESEAYSPKECSTLSSSSRYALKFSESSTRSNSRWHVCRICRSWDVFERLMIFVWAVKVLHKIL